MSSEQMEHTPGPWRVFTPLDYRGEGELPTLGIEAANGDAVVWYGREAENGIANDADAYLIAAAPELLAACERLKDVYGRPSAKRTRAEAWRALDAAVARGKGCRNE